MKIPKRGTAFIPAMKSKSERKMVKFSHKFGRCLNILDIYSSSTVVQRGQGWLRFALGMMGYKDQVVASAIALLICQKIEKSGRSTILTRQISWLRPATCGGL
ncbi:hypothetical protein ACFXTO_022630 [Malus domestica]